MLTSYDGTVITYDAIGNPLNYYTGQTFSWQGRRLVGVVDGSDTYSFTYNDEGIRTSKTKNGVSTTYYLNGAQIMAEETNGNITVYIYDANGAPIGMQYHGVNYSANTWDTYWLEKNLFGDIVAVYDNDGTKLVSYTYDAWGNFTITIHSDEADEMPDNPFTYRGYYYDTDLELYYLQTRYYDSNTGRFINSDGVGYLGENGDIYSYNLFTYCSNNPIVNFDPSGYMPKWAKWVVGGLAVTGLVVATALTFGAAGAGAVSIGGAMLSGGLVSAGVNTINQLRKGGKFDWAELAISTLTGSAYGLVAGMSGTALIGTLGTCTSKLAIAGSSSLLDSWNQEKDFDGYIDSLATSIAMSVATQTIGNKVGKKIPQTSQKSTITRIISNLWDSPIIKTGITRFASDVTKSIFNDIFG